MTKDVPKPPGLPSTYCVRNVVAAGAAGEGGLS
jgi:hypothetical protein